MQTHEAKVIIIGDNSVGKTTILMHYTKGKLEGKIDSTVGASFSSKTVQTSKGPISLHIWDTAGQERYRSLIPMYSRGANAAIIVLDTTKSDYSSLPIWSDLVKANCTSDCKVYVVGNKIDLDMKLPIDKVRAWAKERGIELFLTSAFDLETITPMFQKLSEDLMDIIPPTPVKAGWTNDTSVSSSRNSCSC